MIFNGVTPLSLNQVYATDFKTKRRFKSKIYKEFECQITDILKSDYHGYIKSFSDKFSDEMYIKINLRFYMPVLTKKGDRISKNSKDASNCIKTIEDVLAANFGFNDAVVMNVCATKIHSEDVRIEVDLFASHINTIL